MPDTQDMELVQEFARNGSETAFNELVTRHLNLVYSVALRSTGNDADARDVTQAVFVTLAGKAAALRVHTILPGWLYETTRFIAARFIRTNVRRQHREQEAYMQSTLNEASAGDAWEKLSPHLESGMAQLSEADRALLVLRFYQNKTGAETAAVLGIQEDTAHKRTTRAVEKLRKFFTRHGVTLSAATITAAISANSIQAAPMGLASVISAAALSGTAAATTAAAFATTTKAILMTTVQKAIITVVLAATVGAGIYEAHRNSKLQAQNDALQQQQAPLNAQLAQLAANNAQLSNDLARIKNQNDLSQSQYNELLKLRGQSGQNRTALQELAKAKTAARQSAMMPAMFTNAIAQGVAMAEKFKKKAVLAKAARMKEKLNLTDDQQQAIGAILTKYIEADAQREISSLSGGTFTPADPVAVAKTQEAEIQAVLTPDQAAGYPAFQQSETLYVANSSAASDLGIMTGDLDLNLSTDQQDKARAALVQLKLSQPTPPMPGGDAIAQARATGDLTGMMNLQMEIQKQQLADKVKALDGILTPDQLQTYQQKQTEMIDVQSSALKMFMPPATNGVAQ